MNLEKVLSTTSFKSRLDNIKTHAEQIYKKDALHHKFFTFHGIDHSNAIISVLNDLVDGIRSESELTKEEIFQLLASVYLHDVGMLITYADDEKEAETISTPETAFTKEDVIRREHHKRSGKYIIDNANELGLDQVEKECVRLICEGHRVVDLGGDDYFERYMDDATIRVQFLAALLRFSDELDISYKRAPQKLHEFLREEMPDYSQLQWLKHYYTNGTDISNVTRHKGGRITDINIQIQYPDREQGKKVGELIFTPIQKSFNEVEKIFLHNGLHIILHPPQIIFNKALDRIPDHIFEQFLNSKQKVFITMPETKENDGEEKNVPQMEKHEMDLPNLVEAVEEIGTHYEIIGATNASTITSLCATSVDNPSILYYDLEENVGNESIFIPIYPDLTIPRGGLIYTTESWGENIAFGGDKYAVIDRNASNLIIAGKLIEEHEEDSYLLRVGETITLVDGWSITVLEVDVLGDKAWLSVAKDGVEVNNKVMCEGERFIYTSDLGAPNETEIMNFTLETVFTGEFVNLVKINSINLISADILKIENGNTNLIEGYIIKIDHNRISILNNINIELSIDNVTNIMGGLFTVRVNQSGNCVALVKQIVLH